MRVIGGLGFDWLLPFDISGSCHARVDKCAGPDAVSPKEPTAQLFRHRDDGMARGYLSVLFADLPVLLSHIRPSLVRYGHLM
jgi:hypothetical protein